MAVLIKGMKLPKAGGILLFIDASGKATEGILQEIAPTISGLEHEYDVIEVPPHGRLIDGDALRAGMYHEAFETDSELQRWDSGCWVRYKMFENHMDNAPTIIEAEE